MQVQIGCGDRRVAHPRLNRGGVNAAGQPQAGRRVPEVVDPAAVGDRCPTERALERSRPASSRSRDSSAYLSPWASRTRLASQTTDSAKSLSCTRADYP